MEETWQSIIFSARKYFEQNLDVKYVDATSRGRLILDDEIKDYETYAALVKIPSSKRLLIWGRIIS